MIAFANHFLAGGLITLLIPGTVLIAIAVWYTRLVIRRERDRERDDGAGAGAAPGVGAGDRGEGGASRATP